MTGKTNLKRPLVAVCALVLLNAGLFAVAPAAQGQTNCEQAAVHYRQALEVGEDAAAALPLLRKATALCPNFQGWFVAGNAHWSLNQHFEALAAYEQALALANSPKHLQMAQAYAALVRHRLGETCAASRTFQSLVPDGGAVPAWVREPFEAFELDLAAKGWSPEQMACALETTEAHRTIGVCPKVAVRVEFATDSAVIDAANGAKVRALADALHRSPDSSRRYRLVGHTDSRGGEVHNQALSERRAAGVLASVLARRPSLDGRLEALGKGERELLSPGAEPQDHQLNRRVEVHAVCAGA